MDLINVCHCSAAFKYTVKHDDVFKATVSKESWEI